MGGQLPQYRQCCGAQAPADTANRATVRLVGPEGRIVAGGRRQQIEFGRDGNQPRRHRQFTLEMFEFLEVMLESSRRSARRGTLDDFAGHVRIAVSVTADPRTRPQDRFRQEPGVRPTSAQSFANLGVDLRNHLEQRCVVVAQAYLDFILDAEAAEPDQSRLPQGQDLTAQLQIDISGFCDAQRRALAVSHQLGDPTLRLEHRTASSLRRVSGDDG